MYPMPYATMYKALCTQPTKKNIYTDSAFAPLPVYRAPPAPPKPVYQPTGQCGAPNPTPMYHPPYCTCVTCVTPS